MFPGKTTAIAAWMALSALALLSQTGVAAPACLQANEDLCSPETSRSEARVCAGEKNQASPCNPRNVPDGLISILLSTEDSPALKARIKAQLIERLKSDYAAADSEDEVRALDLDSQTLCNTSDSGQITLRKKLCVFRLNKDLVKYKLLPQWPGCPCQDSRGKRGVRLSTSSDENACLVGTSYSAPIDERVPVRMARFESLLNTSAWAKQNGLHIDSVAFYGCTTFREARSEYSHPDDPLQDLSPHAESRACDLVSVTFKDKQGKLVPFNLDHFAKDNTCPAGSLNYFCLLKKIGGLEFNTTTGNFTRPISQQTAWLTGKIAPQGSESEKIRLQAGIEVEKALLGAHFFIIDPFINKEHHNHIHVSAPLPQDEACFESQSGIDCNRIHLCKEIPDLNDNPDSICADHSTKPAVSKFAHPR